MSASRLIGFETESSGLSFSKPLFGLWNFSISLYMNHVFGYLIITEVLFHTRFLIDGFVGRCCWHRFKKR